MFVRMLDNQEPSFSNFDLHIKVKVKLKLYDLWRKMLYSTRMVSCATTLITMPYSYKKILTLIGKFWAFY